jgi:ParB/RepB/Spo0J family partition protein
MATKTTRKREGETTGFDTPSRKPAPQLIMEKDETATQESDVVAGGRRPQKLAGSAVELVRNAQEFAGRTPAKETAEQLRMGKPQNTTLLMLDARTMEPWRYANRSEEELDTEVLNAEIESAGGQKQPIVVRRLFEEDYRPSRDFPGFTIKYEVVAGRRRWEAIIKKARKEILCQIKNLDDTEALIEQEMENRRKDISSADRARHYRRLLDDRVFTSQESLCRAFGLSKSMIANLLYYTKLPAEIEQVLHPMHTININQVHLIWKYTTHADRAVRKKAWEFVTRNADRLRDGEFSVGRLRSTFESFTLPPTPAPVKKSVSINGSVVCDIKKSATGKVKVSFNRDVADLADQESFWRDLRDAILNF